ncbi:hypothetical protein L1987_52995 [Smallanthus sonchifolius]|uniref:Uncharacterized protein n=1 Tax=Smallanthus sonchifolius TaxID=185202 RepID=A0ACB9EU13_9ASTR|nr:hypothetical protein L1987_52995 [Smallanthus sonchifolius]
MSWKRKGGKLHLVLLQNQRNVAKVYGAVCGRIPLNAVDVFWRKLDLKPSFVDDENVDVDKVLGQDSRQASSVIQHRRSMTSKGKLPQHDNAHLGFPLMIGKDIVNNTNCFKDSIPSVFHPYISHIQDVNPNSNCVFRSVAVGLGLNENR